MFGLEPHCRGKAKRQPHFLRKTKNIHIHVNFDLCLLYLIYSLTKYKYLFKKISKSSSFINSNRSSFSVTESWKYVWLCGIQIDSPVNVIITLVFSPTFQSISEIDAIKASFCCISVGFSNLKNTKNYKT